MSIFKRAWKATKKAVSKAVGADNKPKAPKPDAVLGPSGDTGSRATRSSMADRRRQRRARGRDSTIITARSDIGSRTLLG
jgi:hypothetical protein